MDKYTAEPVIGILSQETAAVEKFFFLDRKFTSFIAASYVKFLECGGARVIPVLIGQNEEYYQRVVHHTNGLLFPGGGTWFYEKKGYAQAGRILYNLALKLNRRGDYYPIWGTCLGMELLAYLSVDVEDPRSDCSCKNISLPLDFRGGYTSSKLFQNAPENVINTLRCQNVTYNYHRFCLTEEKFLQFEMHKEWRILSTNKDINEVEFISCFESTQYPFYGVQFHPEKNQFEFKKNNYAHSKDAVEAAQYFANFFVEECRKNNHKFSDSDSLQRRLIYNYPVYFTGKVESCPYQQIYMFRAPRIYPLKKSTASQTEMVSEILLVQPLEAPEPFQDQEELFSPKESREHMDIQKLIDDSSQTVPGSVVHESVQYDIPPSFSKSVDATEEVERIITLPKSTLTEVEQPPETAEASVNTVQNNNRLEQSTENLKIFSLEPTSEIQDVEQPPEASKTSAHVTVQSSNSQEKSRENPKISSETVLEPTCESQASEASVGVTVQSNNSQEQSTEPTSKTQD